MFKCPNCAQDIDLVGPKEAMDLLDVNVSKFQQLRAKEGFPQPVARFGPANVWLKTDILAFQEKRDEAQIGSVVESLLATLSKLPKSKQGTVLKGLSQEVTKNGRKRSSQATTEKAKEEVAA